jgi:hypothetical protein
MFCLGPPKADGSLNMGICDLPFDLAQGDESLDVARDRELVERPVAPSAICILEGVLSDKIIHGRAILHRPPVWDLLPQDAILLHYFLITLVLHIWS